MTRQLPATTSEQSVEPVSTAILTQQQQAARSKTLKRFNWLVLYVPLIVGSLLAVVLWGVLGWFALVGEVGSADRAQASGVADVFITLVCLGPLALFGAAFAAGGVFLLYWRRQKGSLLRKRIQGLLRNVDGRMNSADARANLEQARVVDYVSRYRNRVETLLDRIYYRTAQIAKWINEQLARNRD
jgi:hypothetical protein